MDFRYDQKLRAPSRRGDSTNGPCIACPKKRTDGVNSGKNGGRASWAIAGTECGGEPQGAFAQKIKTCQSCLFHLIVREEEYPNYTSTKRILPMRH